MDIQLKTQALIPEIEILSLIYVNTNKDQKWGRDHWLEKLEEFSNQKRHLEAIFPIQDRYNSTFLEHYQKSPIADFFFENSQQLLWYAIDLVQENIDLEQSTDDELRQHLAQSLFQTQIQNQSELLEAIKQEDLSPDTNWKLLLMYESPRIYLTQLQELLESNRHAYEQAYLAVEADIEPYLKAFQIPAATILEKFASMLEKKAWLLPILALPFSAVINLSDKEDIIYLNIFLQSLWESSDEHLPKDQLIPTLKLLGDKSKFEILLLLKDAPKYNLEIAKHLGISAPTASHHMSSLLEKGLIELRKQDGKVYYSLRPNGIKELLVALEELLL